MSCARPEDVKCGVLFCSRSSSRPSNSDCNILNPQVLVEDGTRCANESVCQGGRCITIDDAYSSRGCSAKCQKNAECDLELKCHCMKGWAPPNCDTRATQIGAGYIVLIAIVLIVVILIVLLMLHKMFQKNKQRRAADGSSGVANPAFRIENQRKQNINGYPSTPQVGSGNAMYAPQPPASSQKPQTSAMYPPLPPALSQKPQNSAMYPPQPPANSQKPHIPYAYQRPTNVVPTRPAYPSVPPQAMKPNYRR
ncbi:unnamed protein product [Staurois parvus]|uniref:EGF-like domain-containing protein n=1 Tax=Staurois parvus TaxID=386267 RepID=A0ABN9HI65_9NEOB|nr:unnamed protein product [Staurois parvus]